MYVCNCAGVTHRELHNRLDQGTVCFKELRAELGLCKGCGKCAREVCEMLKGRVNSERNRVESLQT